MLTSAQVREARGRPGRYLDQHGLYLVVQTPEKRYWQFRYMLAGRERLMSFGPEGPITLDGARQRHLEARALIARGVDPLEERKKAQAPTRTFEAVALEYVAAHEAGWRNPIHRQQWRNTLTSYAYPAIGAKPVSEITTADVLGVLKPHWNSKPESMSRLRGRIEAILSYAKTLGLRSGENPAAWRDNLIHALPSKGKVKPTVHHAALPWRDCPALLAKLMAPDASMGARALAFAILTAARSGEVRGMTWSETDVETATWTVPALRMKAGREHRVPLSEPALGLLEGAKGLRQSPLVFPGRDGRSPLSDMTLTAVLRRMGRGDLTAHGFRSSFRDWAADTGRSADAAEAALAHAPASKVVVAYARSDLLDLRRGLMAEWAAFLTRPPADVVPLQSAAA
jgi:integrase